MAVTFEFHPVQLSIFKTILLYQLVGIYYTHGINYIFK